MTSKARDYIRMIDAIQDDLEDFQQEAVRLCFTSVALITMITVLAYHLGDSTALILLYMGWCLYVTFWSIIYYHRVKRREGEKLKTLGSSLQGELNIKRGEIHG